MAGCTVVGFGRWRWGVESIIETRWLRELPRWRRMQRLVDRIALLSACEMRRKNNKATISKMVRSVVSQTRGQEQRNIPVRRVVSVVDETTNKSRPPNAHGMGWAKRRLLQKMRREE
jgi:hypothetical protein